MCRGVQEYSIQSSNLHSSDCHDWAPNQVMPAPCWTRSCPVNHSAPPVHIRCSSWLSQPVCQTRVPSFQRALIWYCASPNRASLRCFAVLCRTWDGRANHRLGMDCCRPASRFCWRVEPSHLSNILQRIDCKWSCLNSCCHKIFTFNRNLLRQTTLALLAVCSLVFSQFWNLRLVSYEESSPTQFYFLLTSFVASACVALPMKQRKLMPFASSWRKFLAPLHPHRLVKKTSLLLESCSGIFSGSLKVINRWTSLPHVASLPPPFLPFFFAL